MTNRNYNRQQVFFECGAGAIFLLSHNEPPASRSDYNAYQTTAFLCRTLQFVVGGFTHGQLATAHHDGDGWFILARTLLDARLFHSPPKVAGDKIKAGRQKSLQMGQIAGEKVCKRGTGRSAAAAELRRKAAEIEVEASAEGGRECNKKCSTTEKTDENQRVCEDFKADAPDSKFSNAPHAGTGPVVGTAAEQTGGGGGGELGRTRISRWVGTNAEFGQRRVGLSEYEELEISQAFAQPV